MKISFVRNHIYWVFRRYKSSGLNSEVGQAIEESFALHFVESFRSKKSAQNAINLAKQTQPWQEFIILRGC